MIDLYAKICFWIFVVFFCLGILLTEEGQGLILTVVIIGFFLFVVKGCILVTGVT